MGKGTNGAKSEASPKVPPKSVSRENSNEKEVERIFDRAVSPMKSLLRRGGRHIRSASIDGIADPLGRRPLRRAYTNGAAAPDVTTTSRPPMRSSESDSRPVELAPPVNKTGPVVNSISVNAAPVNAAPVDAAAANAASANAASIKAVSAHAVQLQLQLSESEGKARHALTQLDREKRERENLGKHCQELLKFTESLEAQVKDLTQQLEETKVELEETRSHILSIQPYVKDITPEEIGRDFDDLYGSICNWVETWMTPIFDSEESCKEVFYNARKNISKTTALRNMMNSHPDLLRVTEFPDTNQDAAVAAVMRYLYMEIFSKVLFDTVPDHVRVLQQIEDAMRESVQPKRDTFAVRNWRAESFTSLVSHAEFASAREDRRRRMAVQIGKLFRLLIPRNADSNDFYATLDENVIGPAMRLHEKIQSSIHHYWFVLNEYGGLAAGGDDLARASELLDEFDQVDCEDVFRNRKRLDVTQLRDYPRPEILTRLYPICTISPCLMMRQVGRGEIIKEPRVIRKQKTLIAWGTYETRVAKLGQETRTLMNAIHHARPLR